jgi:hypothetical protein
MVVVLICALKLMLQVKFFNYIFVNFHLQTDII